MHSFKTYIEMVIKNETTLCDIDEFCERWHAGENAAFSLREALA